MTLVQLILTTDQAELAAAALRDAANSEDVTLEESQVIYDLGYFLQTVGENPSKYRPNGKMATSIKRAQQRPGPNAGNTSASVKNKRKARQEKRAGWNKLRRKNRREMVANYNQAVETMAAERAEMEAAFAEQQAILDAEPKFDVFTVDGARIISGVPESMIRPVELDIDSIAQDESDATPVVPEIILP